MSHKFFSPFIKDYTELIKSAVKNNHIEIKTSADITDIMTEPKSIAHNLTRKVKSANSSKIQETRDSRRAINIEVQMQQCINTFMQTCTKIGERYIRDSIFAALDYKNYKYDAAIIWDPTFRAYSPPSTKYKSAKRLKLSQDEIFERGYAEHNRKLASGILAVIIVQKGECSRFGDELNKTMSVRLICANNSTNAKNLARILMGLFIFSVKKYREKLPSFLDSNVILELAGSYVNMAGFCSYDKFGFKYFPMSEAGACYNDNGVLPMYMNTEEITIEQIAGIVLGTTSLKKSVLCQDRFYNLPQKPKLVVLLLITIRDFLETVIYEQSEMEKDEYYRLNPRIDNGLDPFQFRALTKLMSRFSKYPGFKDVTRETADRMIYIKEAIWDPSRDLFLYEIPKEDLELIRDAVNQYIEYIIDHPSEHHIGFNKPVVRSRSRSKSRSSLKNLPFRRTRSMG
jgi:hypothetical protein